MAANRITAEDRERARIEEEHIDKGTYRMKVDKLHYHVGEPESDKDEQRRQLLDRLAVGQ